MKDNNSCNCRIIDSCAVTSASQSMPDERILYEISLVLDAMGDLNRIKIISALCKSEMCVCDIANVLSMSHSAVSHQLRILRHTGIVSARKEGKIVYYRLADEHIKEIYNIGLTHILHLWKEYGGHLHGVNKEEQSYGK